MIEGRIRKLGPVVLTARCHAHYFQPRVSGRSRRGEPLLLVQHLLVMARNNASPLLSLDNRRDSVDNLFPFPSFSRFLVSWQFFFKLIVSLLLYLRKKRIIFPFNKHQSNIEATIIHEKSAKSRSS